MNIACDGRALVGPRTGVGAWTLQLCRGLAAVDRWRVTVLATQHPQLPPELLASGIEAAAPRPRLPGTVWLHSVVPRWLESTAADLFIGSLAIVPRRCPVPSVAVVHDLTPRTLAHHHTVANRFCFNAYLEVSLDEAEAIVAVSRATADALTAAFPWVRAKLRVIENAIGAAFFEPVAVDAVTTRARFAAGRPYIVHLGTLEPRKGILDLLSAWEALVGTDAAAPDLVLAGTLGWQPRPLLSRLKRSPYADRVHRPGYVSDGDARALLRHAEVFVLASEAEGFGLPLAEAMASGAACVASDVPALREVAGEAAVLVPPGSVEALAAALRRALEPEESARLRELGPHRARRFAPDRMAARWHELIASLGS
jgi:glycosyltransferase involved in cell wall biosynthesis